MLVELPPVWIVVLNVVCIPALHLGVAWIVTRMPAGWFRPEGWLFRPRPWEHKGVLYERWFGVRSWKGWLPDGAPWVKGFPKKKLVSRDRDYVRTFLVETCRGEFAHYAQIPAVLLTLAWNPWPVAALVIIVYVVLSNLPCILVQRHTRSRFAHLLARIPEE